METIIIVNLFASFFLCGLIWIIQIVHYPFFKYTDPQRFEEAMTFHKKKISLIVVPIMLVELVSSFWLSFFSKIYTTHHIAGFIIVLLIWGITFTIQVPLHGKLSNNRNQQIIHKLVQSNWTRTVLWSAKALLGIWILKINLI